METKKCRYCQAKIDRKAKVCPACRNKQDGKAKWFIIGVLLVLGLTGAILTPREKSASDRTEFGIGETAELDDIYVTFVGVTESKGSGSLTPADGKVFVLCEFDIANHTDEKLAVSSMVSFEAYCDDKLVAQNLSALAGARDKDQLDGSIAAGKKMNGVIGYEVPADWSELKIKYTPYIKAEKSIIFAAAK